MHVLRCVRKALKSTRRIGVAPFQTNAIASSHSVSAKKAYKERHLIANAFFRLKGIRRIATRYDRLTVNPAASIYLVAAVVR